MSSNQKDFVQNALPLEISRKIFTYLDGISLLNCTLVSKRWHEVASGSTIWKHLLEREYGKENFFSAENAKDWHGLYNVVDTISRDDDPDTEPIAFEALGASTEDDYNQGPEFTLTSSGFYSSTGNPDKDSDEWIDYKLTSRFSVLHCITIRPFMSRACYAPRKVQICIGLTPGNWHYQSEEFDCENIPNMQTFRLKHPFAAIGGYVRLKMIGKHEKHFAMGHEHQYYTCISSVQLLGKSVNSLPRQFRRCIYKKALEYSAWDIVQNKDNVENETFNQLYKVESMTLTTTPKEDKSTVGNKKYSIKNKTKEIQNVPGDFIDVSQNTDEDLVENSIIPQNLNEKDKLDMIAGVFDLTVPETLPDEIDIANSDVLSDILAQFLYHRHIQFHTA